jgi:hypothetical protein
MPGIGYPHRMIRWASLQECEQAASFSPEQEEGNVPAQPSVNGPQYFLGFARI